jgi:hypothetical protein
LNLQGLETEVEKGDNADLEVVKNVLMRLDSGANGWELAQLARLRDAVRQWSEDLVIAKAPGLREAAHSLESDYRPVTEADVEDAKRELQADMTKLAERLVRWGANGKRWREYLRWKDLEKHLKSDALDTDILKSVHQEFTANENGLEMPEFRNVAAALDRNVNAQSARGIEAPTNTSPTFKAWRTN